MAFDVMIRNNWLRECAKYSVKTFSKWEDRNRFNEFEKGYYVF